MSAPNPAFQYDAAPWLVIEYSCSGIECGTGTVEFDADGGVCNICGTFWSVDSSDLDNGVQYSDWSGEDVSNLPVKER